MSRFFDGRRKKKYFHLIISDDSISNVWKRNGATEKSAIKDGSPGWGRVIASHTESPKIYIALNYITFLL
jgi:hypothetical protein